MNVAEPAAAMVAEQVTEVPLGVQLEEAVPAPWAPEPVLVQLSRELIVAVILTVCDWLDGFEITRRQEEVAEVERPTEVRFEPTALKYTVRDAADAFAATKKASPARAVRRLFFPRANIVLIKLAAPFFCAKAKFLLGAAEQERDP